MEPRIATVLKKIKGEFIITDFIEGAGSRSYSATLASKDHPEIVVKIGPIEQARILNKEVWQVMDIVTSEINLAVDHLNNKLAEQ